MSMMMGRVLWRECENVVKVIEGIQSDRTEKAEGARVQSE